ncbi:c-type cytochrome [Aromatoleum toluvorans]|uniref:C-type cytochrome n=1 Tax=Aromatoleum toluvorans TaxID=92002 RepID=A0ABX1PZ11_9RHOO|nr:cytochrome c [Aromatoleum toluvorans]NMG44688.1 c-type cytochrome [Aromatoleum toluvorans]
MKAIGGLTALLVAALAAPGAALAANVVEGQRIYNQHCIGCHGPGGNSAIPNAPKFARGERLMQPDMILLASIKAGKMTMPSFNGILRDQEILDVIAYLRTLQR